MIFLQKASKNGSVKFFSALANMYFRGEVVKKDIEQGLLLYKKSSELWNEKATAYLKEIMDELGVGDNTVF